MQESAGSSLMSLLAPELSVLTGTCMQDLNSKKRDRLSLARCSSASHAALNANSRMTPDSDCTH